MIKEPLIKVVTGAADAGPLAGESTIECPSCYGTGEWETECCNGSGGCSCRGQVVPMGQCNVCNGTGKVPSDVTEEQRMANCKAIAGLCFIGSGPSTGIWAGEGARGNFV